MKPIEDYDAEELGNEMTISVYSFYEATKQFGQDPLVTDAFENKKEISNHTFRAVSSGFLIALKLACPSFDDAKLGDIAVFSKKTLISHGFKFV